MEDAELALPEEISELVFRLYILEESTSLLLLKSQRVLKELSQSAGGESRRGSVSSQRTGVRSALSESLEVFKRNQLRVELERSELLLPDNHHTDTQIQSDYKMTVRRAERKPGKVDPRNVCCFRL